MGIKLAKAKIEKVQARINSARSRASEERQRRMCTQSRGMTSDGLAQHFAAQHAAEARRDAFDYMGDLCEAILEALDEIKRELDAGE